MFFNWVPQNFSPGASYQAIRDGDIRGSLLGFSSIKVLFSFRSLLNILKERRAVSVKHIYLGPAIPLTEVYPQLSGMFQLLQQGVRRPLDPSHWWGIQRGLIGSTWSVLAPPPFPEPVEAGGIWNSEFFQNSEASKMHLLYVMWQLCRSTPWSNTDLSAARCMNSHMTGGR